MWYGPMRDEITHKPSWWANVNAFSQLVTGELSATQSSQYLSGISLFDLARGGPRIWGRSDHSVSVCTPETCKWSRKCNGCCLRQLLAREKKQGSNGDFCTTAYLIGTWRLTYLIRSKKIKWSKQSKNTILYLLGSHIRAVYFQGHLINRLHGAGSLNRSRWHAELVKKFLPSFYGTQWFITAFTRVRHRSQYRTRLKQSTTRSIFT
jgi:hypothetical protein